jgi:hypothetical protein
MQVLVRNEPFLFDTIKTKVLSITDQLYVYVDVQTVIFLSFIINNSILQGKGAIYCIV